MFAFVDSFCLNPLTRMLTAPLNANPFPSGNFITTLCHFDPNFQQPLTQLNVIYFDDDLRQK